ncbi:MAG: bifunctional hydroxymethylpyrimidine kinase/phosphomethylpyrimidine kinase [Thermomicrobiales bacterium]|nr:bifunctional hydroxymethylpyrimidine kinase/phosphomethylpyrimidine kinase [Thermomicrobiales bacterium]
MPKALTIAGSDSGAGAGIQADLKTFAAHGVYGTSAITAVTAQNTREVIAIAEVPEEVVAAQIDSVLEDIGANAIKTGMLSSVKIVATVAERIEAWGIPTVVDPVMVSKSGNYLLAPDAIGAIKRDLIPRSLIVTPNHHEAAALTGVEIESDEDAREAALRLADLGARIVVIKGGHRPGSPIDLVYDGIAFTELDADRVETENTHGTGCTFSAAIAANLALGHGPLDSIERAKTYLTQALRTSYRVGGGHSPVNHFHTFEPISSSR